MYDPIYHQRVDDDEETSIAWPSRRSAPTTAAGSSCKRPFIVSGGELTLDMLDLRYNADLQGLRSALPVEGQQRHLPDRRLRPAARHSRRSPEPLDRADGAARRLPELHDRRQDDRAVRGLPGLLHQPESAATSATRPSCAAFSTRCCCAGRRENEFVRIFESFCATRKTAVTRAS